MAAQSQHQMFSLAASITYIMLNTTEIISKTDIKTEVFLTFFRSSLSY